MDYRETLEYLYGFQKRGIKFGLLNITRLLESLGNPQHGLKVIQVAGTNGKGSTAAFIESILMEAGFKVGLYSSPHFLRFTERIRVNRREIPEPRVIELVSLIRSKLSAMAQTKSPVHITFFEFVTAMALLHFLEEQVDFAVLETGMGGRLDATNVSIPLVSVITNVSMEHKEFLGGSLSRIAREKAGIIKGSAEVLSGADNPAVLRVIEEACRKKATPLYLHDRDFKGLYKVPNRFDYQGMELKLEDIKLGLMGRHQAVNASLAIAAVEILGRKGTAIGEGAIRRGISRVAWRGRLEVLSHRPCVVLDGAHNPEASRHLRRALDEIFEYDRLWLVLGIMKDKDYHGIIKALSQGAHGVIAVRPRMDRSLDPELIEKAAAKEGVRATTIRQVEKALEYSLRVSHPKDLICITGSLFTVAEAMAYFDNSTAGLEASGR